MSTIEENDGINDNTNDIHEQNTMQVATENDYTENENEEKMDRVNNGRGLPLPQSDLYDDKHDSETDHETLV